MLNRWWVLAALLCAGSAQASSYEFSFRNATFYYSGFSEFNGQPSDGLSHTFGGADNSPFASGIAEQGASFRLAGDFHYKLVLDKQDGARCDFAVLRFAAAIGFFSTELLPGPTTFMCSDTQQMTWGEDRHFDYGFTGLDAGPIEAYFLDASQIVFAPVPDPTPVPEPSTCALLAGGLALVSANARRRARRSSAGARAVGRGTD